METNNIESVSPAEQTIEFSSKDFANKFLTLDDNLKVSIRKAIEALNVEYGADSSHSTFEGLFSADFLEIINPDHAHDEENKKWRVSQIQYLSNLRQELINAKDQVSVDEAARNLADHMINL